MQRNDEIERMFRAGNTLASIGASVCLTREGVRQILKKRGLTWMDGGAAVARSAKDAKLAASVKEWRDARAFKVYGCTHAVVVELNGCKKLRAPNCLADQYQRQRRSAKRRRIAWLFTFPQWVAIWRDSGLLDRRGCKRGAYCMARFGDVGPYSPENVHIVNVSANHAERMGLRYGSKQLA